MLPDVYFRPSPPALTKGPKAVVQIHRHRSCNDPAPALICACVSAVTVQRRRHYSSKGSSKGPAPAPKSSLNFNLVVPPQSLQRRREPVVALLNEKPSLSRTRRGEPDANPTRTLQIPLRREPDADNVQSLPSSCSYCLSFFFEASNLFRQIDHLPPLHPCNANPTRTRREPCKSPFRLA